MSTRVNIAVHVIVAAAFFYYVQSQLLGESTAISLVWSLAAALGAGGLAFMQSRRNL
jgi:hypothetical protein